MSPTPAHQPCALIGSLLEAHEQYRKQQLALTSKGMLPPRMPAALADAVPGADSEHAAAAQKPKMKIEIVPAGRKKGS